MSGLPLVRVVGLTIRIISGVTVTSGLSKVGKNIINYAYKYEKNMVSVAFSLVKQEPFFIKWLAVSKLVFYLNYCLYYVYNMTYMYSKSNFDFPFLPG